MGTTAVLLENTLPIPGCQLVEEIFPETDGRLHLDSWGILPVQQERQPRYRERGAQKFEHSSRLAGTAIVEGRRLTGKIEHGASTLQHRDVMINRVSAATDVVAIRFTKLPSRSRSALPIDLIPARFSRKAACGSL